MVRRLLRRPFNDSKWRSWRRALRLKAKSRRCKRKFDYSRHNAHAHSFTFSQTTNIHGDAIQTVTSEYLGPFFYRQNPDSSSQRPTMSSRCSAASQTGACALFLLRIFPSVCNTSMCPMTMSRTMLPHTHTCFPRTSCAHL